jgi:hypothetical protein
MLFLMLQNTNLVKLYPKFTAHNSLLKITLSQIKIVKFVTSLESNVISYTSNLRYFGINNFTSGSSATNKILNYRTTLR